MAMKKRKSKLLGEIVTAVLPIFVIVTVFVGYLIYKNGMESFLKAKQDEARAMLEQIFNDIYQLRRGWYYDYWKKYPDICKVPLTVDETDKLYSYIDVVMKDVEADVMSDEWCKQIPDEDMRLLMARETRSNFDFNFTYEIEVLKGEYESIMLIDPRDGFIYSDITPDGPRRELGDRVDFDLRSHPELQKAFQSNSKEIIFEKTKDFPAEGTFYVAYKPIFYGGQLRAYLVYSMGWTDMLIKVFFPFVGTIVTGAGGIGLIFVVLFLLIYRRAVNPAMKMQKSVRQYIATKDSNKVISDMDTINLANEFGQLSADIANLAREIDEYTEDIVKMTGERQRVVTELETAKNIQAGQLPSTFPAFPDRTEFDIYASMTPAKEVGGDFYDYFFIDDDHLALVMADVSGKGVPAALFMMMSKILLHNYSMMGLTPHEVLERTNESICENNPEKMFVTVWLGILEVSTGKIIASNAGHEYPILRQPDGRYEVFKDKHGFVLGALSGKKYKDYEFTLGKGGALFVYTDGVPEATRSDNELYGLERLTLAMNRDVTLSPEDLLKSIHADVNEFVGDAPQFDDLTMMAIKICDDNKTDKRGTDNA